MVSSNCNGSRSLSCTYKYIRIYMYIYISWVYSIPSIILIQFLPWPLHTSYNGPHSNDFISIPQKEHRAEHPSGCSKLPGSINCFKLVILRVWHKEPYHILVDLVLIDVLMLEHPARAAQWSCSAHGCGPQPINANFAAANVDSESDLKDIA